MHGYIEAKSMADHAVASIIIYLVHNIVLQTTEVAALQFLRNIQEGNHPRWEKQTNTISGYIVKVQDHAESEILV